LGVNFVFLQILQLCPNFDKENLDLLYGPPVETRKDAYTDGLEAFYKTKVVPGSDLFLVRKLVSNVFH
jgi:hypothetical protein